MLFLPRWYDPATGRFLNEDPARDGSNWYAYAGNDPINFVDPTGLSAQGNPLNNLYGSFDVYGGGYSGGKVAAAPPPVYVNSTLNYNPLAAPTFSAQQLFGGAPTIKGPSSSYTTLGNVATNVVTSAFNAFNPLATTVVNTGLGIGAGTIATVLPPMRGSANQEQSFFDTVNPFGLYYSGRSEISKHAERDRQIAKIQQDNVSKLEGFEYIEAQRTLNQGRAENAARDIKQAAETGIQFNAAALGGGFVRPATPGAKPINATRPQHGAPIHDATAFNAAKAWSGERTTVEVRFNQQLVDASGNAVSGFRPDAQRIRLTTGGRKVVDVLEVRSESQTKAYMNAKIEHYRRALGDQAGTIRWVEATKGAKR